MTIFLQDSSGIYLHIFEKCFEKLETDPYRDLLRISLATFMGPSNWNSAGFHADLFPISPGLVTGNISRNSHSAFLRDFQGFFLFLFFSRSEFLTHFRDFFSRHSTAGFLTCLRLVTERLNQDWKHSKGSCRIFFGFQPLAVRLGSLGLFLIRKILWDFSGSSSWHLLGIFFLLRIFQDLSVVFQDSGGKISGYPSLFSGSFFIWIFYGFSGFDSEFLLRILRGFSRIFCGILWFDFYNFLRNFYSDLSRTFQDFLP